MVPILLIADADQELRDLYRRFFVQYGWRVETTGGGVDCLEHLRRDRPDVLILDGILPWGGHDGLLAVMRDDPSLGRVPVILTSTLPRDAMPAATLSPPVVGVLLKPFSLPQVHALARAAVEIHTDIASIGTGSEGRERGLNEQVKPPAMTPEQLARIEEHIRCRLSGRVRDFQLVVRGNGLVLRGHAHTYHAKQLAQEAVMEATDLTIRANDIEVS